VVPGFFAFKKVKEMADPAIVAERTRELLGAADLPEGYESQLALSVPLMGELVVISGNDRNFVYIRGARITEDPERLDRGEIDLLDLLRSGRVHLRRVEQLASGRFELDTLRVDWATVTGYVRFEGVQTSDDEPHAALRDEDKLATVMLLRCPGDRPRRARIALWSAEGEAPDEVYRPGGLAGTVGDPDEIRKFLSSFDICG
jgi:hypothetical protein